MKAPRDTLKLDSNDEPRDGPSALRPEEIAELHKALTEERERVLSRLTEHMAVVRAPDDSMSADEFDQASNDLERGNMLRIADKENKLLIELDRALQKIAEGQYGICEGTQEPIGFKRLRARPWARYSIEYKEQLEREERGYSRG